MDRSTSMSGLCPAMALDQLIQMDGWEAASEAFPPGSSRLLFPLLQTSLVTIFNATEVGQNQSCSFGIAEASSMRGLLLHSPRADAPAPQPQLEFEVSLNSPAAKAEDGRASLPSLGEFTAWSVGFSQWSDWDPSHLLVLSAMPPNDQLKVQECP
ncbi:unnamed protein product [Lepidochelys kempii]